MDEQCDCLDVENIYNLKGMKIMSNFESELEIQNTSKYFLKFRLTNERMENTEVFILWGVT
jgi:hypothetical protein